MPLPLTVDKLDAVPEALRSAYVEKDGRFVLDAEVEDTSGLKQKNQDLINKNRALADRAKILGDRTPEEIQADLELAKQTREAKAKAEGDFNSLKEQLVKQHQSEIEKVSGRTKKVEGKLYDVLAKREAEAAITAAGGNPKVLLPHILPFIKVTENDEDFTAVVVDAKGNARIADGNGTPMSIVQLVEQFKADEAFGVAFSASGSNGGGARNPGSPSGGNSVVTITAQDAKDVQKYRAARAKAEELKVPLQVVG